MVKFRVKIIPLKLQLLALVFFPVAMSDPSSEEIKNYIFSRAESYFLAGDF
jgi:hypothetical protein